MPQQVFSARFTSFLFITFDELFIPRYFFRHSKEYLPLVGESDFWFAVIAPDPQSYFYHHFGIFSVALFSTTDDDAAYLAALSDFPRESPADAIMHNSNQILLSSRSERWAVFADRDSDIAICAFRDIKAAIAYRSVYGDELLPSLEAAAEYAFGPGEDRILEKQQFRLQYANRAS